MLITQYSCHKIKPLLAIFSVCMLQYLQQPYSNALSPYATWFQMPKVESFQKSKSVLQTQKKKGRENDENLNVTST